VKIKIKSELRKKSRAPSTADAASPSQTGHLDSTQELELEPSSDGESSGSECGLDVGDEGEEPRRSPAHWQRVDASLSPWGSPSLDPSPTFWDGSNPDLNPDPDPACGTASPTVVVPSAVRRRWGRRKVWVANTHLQNMRVEETANSHHTPDILSIVRELASRS
jgi:hypothetical protein